MTTLTHRNRQFEVCRDDSRDDDDTSSRWFLRPVSGRGKVFNLFRNAHDRTKLFGVSCPGLAVLPGWFTDADGNLKSLG